MVRLYLLTLAVLLLTTFDGPLKRKSTFGGSGLFIKVNCIVFSIVQSLNGTFFESKIPTTPSAIFPIVSTSTDGGLGMVE